MSGDRAMLKKQSSPKVVSADTGKLQIGDQWNAISIIAHSQTHPLKAVCELVENAIDAQAEHIDIVRRRTKNQIFLEIFDNGNGVLLNDNGLPDFDHIATHICDSMKRHFSRRDRVGVHGEFGIGLLSFWSLGEQLRMVSGDDDGQLHEMVLKRGDQAYKVKPLRGVFDTGGTQIIIGPLLETTRNILTGDKLQRFLSAELRDRIRVSGAKIHITDKISRKHFVVTPREFEGDRLDEIRDVATPHGKLIVELYLRPSADSRQQTHVAVCKDGTRVLQDITELIQFDQAPWTNGRLEGILDFAAFNLAPGTRKGVVPDEQLEAFIVAVDHIEHAVQKAIQRRDEAESTKANRQILRQVKRAFMVALRELPDDQYLYFDVPYSNKRRRIGNAAKEESTEQPKTARAKKEVSVASSVKPGQLDTVLITPRNARRQPKGECVLMAEAYDGADESLTQGTTFRWSIVEGKGRLKNTKASICTLTSAKAGRVVVEVKGKKGVRSATDRVGVKFLKSEEDYGSSRGLPSYRLQAEHNQAWRSRYDVKKNEITINSSHRDFIASQTTLAKHRRYVGKLYAKEVVLLNFPHESSSEAMERLIEVIVRTEDAL